MPTIYNQVIEYLQFLFGKRLLSLPLIILIVNDITIKSVPLYFVGFISVLLISLLYLRDLWKMLEK